MLFSLEIIKKNNLDCNWITLYVGRKFKIISSSDVIRFSTEYLNNHEEVKDLNIIELACNSQEDKVDDLLYDVVNNILEFDADEDSIELNEEFHKWRYCVIKEIYLKSKEDEELFKNIEEVFSLFQYPKDMYEFFRNISDIFYYTTEKSNTMNDLVINFLENEKLFF